MIDDLVFLLVRVFNLSGSRLFSICLFAWILIFTEPMAALLVPTQVLIKAKASSVSPPSVNSEAHRIPNVGSMSLKQRISETEQSCNKGDVSGNADCSSITQQYLEDKSSASAIECGHIDENSEIDYSLNDFGPLFGDSPNIYWRAIPMEDIRLHPLFEPLPEPSEVKFESYEDLGRFRQDTWQWDALHQGRLTTSRIAAILGFYEPKSATLLKIPNSLQGHDRVTSAWSHLCHKPPLHWDHLKECSLNSSLKKKHWPNQSSSQTWRPSQTGFPFQYTPHPASQLSFAAGRKIRDTSDARMRWGSAQEATALLGVINYMAKIDVSAKVKEVGMLMFEALPEIRQIPSNYVDLLSENLYFSVFHQMFHEQTLPLVGASPDGIIELSNGDLEIVEIKCHSPFIYNQQESKPGKFCVTFKRHPDSSFPTWHIPQIMMEMFCGGSRCKSALVVVCYADGIKYFRFTRDDAYIAEMFFWIAEYYKVNHKRPSNKLKPPPINFQQPQGNRRYCDFLSKSIEVARSAILVHESNSVEVQRSPSNINFFHM